MKLTDEQKAIEKQICDEMDEADKQAQYWNRRAYFLRGALEGLNFPHSYEGKQCLDEYLLMKKRGMEQAKTS